MKLASLVLSTVVASLATAAAGAKANRDLVGVWKGHVEDGATGHILTFTATHVSGKRVTDDLGEGTFVLDRTKKPWVLDATCTRGTDRGSTYLGICLLKGDTLKWCVSTPGSARPTKFATAGSAFCLVLKRQKKK